MWITYGFSLEYANQCTVSNGSIFALWRSEEGHTPYIRTTAHRYSRSTTYPVVLAASCLWWP
ncbi:hypothetical protein SAMN04488688_10197 [Paenibacillus sp. cl141a]|nr:hypothetical protein SAMN04488688_10197 [Paenibacillus sp. cl141a]